MIEVENVVSVLQRSGPVIVMGDFNAHIGQPYSERTPGQTNAQGQLLLDLINRSNQYIASLVNTAAGATYTFCSGNYYTVVDYCLVDSWAAHLVSSCEILDRHALNRFDHLAIRIKLDCHPQLLVHPMQNQPKLNWRKSQKDGSLCQYQAAVSSNLALFLHSTIENNDISEVEN